MCLIIYDSRDETERVTKDVFDRAYASNSHGVGLMYPIPETGELKIWKSLDDVEGVYNRYTTQRDRGRPVAVHFRLTSAGSHSLENCHPFRIRGQEICPQLGFMHNGTITGYSKWMDDEVSDTRFFRDAILNSFPEDFIHSEPLLKTIREAIGWDRMLFMDGYGEVAIVNESRGEWIGDIWFSHGGGKRVLYGSTRDSSRSRTRAGADGHMARHRYCMRCKKHGHYHSDCPDHPDIESESSSNEGGWCGFGGESRSSRYVDPYDCGWCRNEHDHKAYEVCPDTIDEHGRCIFCGAYNGHAADKMDTYCYEVQGIPWPKAMEEDKDEESTDYGPCEYCEQGIESDDLILDGRNGEVYRFHRNCPIAYCGECNQPIAKHEATVRQDDGLHHARPEECGSSNPLLKEGGYTVWTYPGDAPPEEATDFKVRSIVARTGVEMPVSNFGIYYDSHAICFDCLDQLFSDTYDPTKSYEVPIPADKRMEIHCRVCEKNIARRD